MVDLNRGVWAVWRCFQPKSNYRPCKHEAYVIGRDERYDPGASLLWDDMDHVMISSFSMSRSLPCSLISQAS
jgi:hypothetical protein